jgi:hypothetical protein
MKTLKKLFAIVIAVFAIGIFSSCEKEDDLPTPTESDVNVTAEAIDDSTVTTENTSVTVSVLSNDKGTGNEIVSVSIPSNGTAINNGDGTITYTPDNSFTGTDSFTYEIFDDLNHSDIATVTVTVNSSGGGTNTAPVANNDSETTNMNTATTISVLSNDTDADSDALTVTNVTGASNGTATTDGTTVSYTPNSMFIGTETLTYTISDGTETTTATITITVGNASQTATYNILSPYFGVEMTTWGETSNKLTLNSDGTFSEINNGPMGSTYSGSWTLNADGDIAFEVGVSTLFPNGIIHSVTTYSETVSSTTYTGYSLSSTFNYAQF